ncbi:hypothetical protein VFPPC_07952 [Pochonia chlamydosporia 170]|uniref:Uncharacterized protein n=1 Tax=Pochonia chlamydosporia 170 TaxID=1380566 RepID=A0A179FM30_METCM|nr:hypothetical protein VFPPC_07952 [Pochonia chlamydosporia 170]OAQ66388.2 hypothetical protein VFPPC_07952 [Pochonia chlamydosporia 170]
MCVTTNLSCSSNTNFQGTTISTHAKITVVPRLFDHYHIMRVLHALSTVSHKENAKTAVPPTLLNQQRSYFLYDKSDSRLETVLHHFRRPRETWRDRKRPIVFLCVGLFILVAAVVGIAVGVRAATDTHANPNGEEGTSVHKDSRITVSQFFARKNDTASRLMFFQDGAGDLVVVEDRQNLHTTYRLKSRLAKLPQALAGTPLRVEFFGGDKRIHLFYLDLENYIRHATGILPVAGPVSWQINPAFTKGGNESHRSGQHMATAVIGSANASLPGEVVGLAFWSMDDKNQRRLILSDKPASESIWHENRMESDQSVDKKMTESSIELVSLSVPPAGLSGAYFPRIISNYPMGTPNDNITRVDCGIRSLNDEIICLEDLVDWKRKSKSMCPSNLADKSS